MVALEENSEASVEPIEISIGKMLFIGTKLSTKQKQQVISMVQKNFGAFAWDYLDMKGIYLDMCTHHIYTN